MLEPFGRPSRPGCCMELFIYFIYLVLDLICFMGLMVEFGSCLLIRLDLGQELII